jgi:hypothetical protein
VAPPVVLLVPVATSGDGASGCRCSDGNGAVVVQGMCGSVEVQALEVLVGVGQVCWSEVLLLWAKVWPVLAGRRPRRSWASLSFLEALSRRSTNPLLPDQVLQVKAKILV